MTAHTKQRPHSQARVSLRESRTRRILVPLAGTLTPMKIDEATKAQFLAAIREALKAKYSRQSDIDKFIWNLFHGEYAVSEDLDNHERWYVLDAVARLGNDVKQRLFAKS